MTNRVISTESFTCRFFHHNGLRLAYWDNDQASVEVPIFLLHGFSASAQVNWIATGWMDKLTQAKRRVIALDARGHGESDKPYHTDFYPANLMMSDSIALMNQLAFDQVDYCGYSMGARMSAFVAIKHPTRVRKLILGGMGLNLKTGIGRPEPIAQALLAKNLKEIKQRHARRFRLLAERGGNDLTALAYCILSSRQPITATDLASIQAKTLILVGAEDDTGGNPYGLSPFIPDSQAVEVQGCNHFNALTNQKFQQIAMRFLQSG